MQFTRDMQPGQVKIDLLAAPLGEVSSRVKKDVRRARPKPSVKLHASKLEEVAGVDRDTLRIPVSGIRSSGDPRQTEVLIPQAFTFGEVFEGGPKERVSGAEHRRVRPGRR